MEKHKLLSLVKKTANHFGDYTSPTSVYQSLWDDTHFKPLLNKMSPEDIIFYSFLIPVINKGQDIDEIYDRIENNMYTVELVEIYNTEPEVDCPECHLGFISCDNCDGTGEVDCDYCWGRGQDSEGEECNRCDGNGTESCDYCGGDGDNICSNCDGDGKLFSDTSVEIIHNDYISWSPRWKDYFFRSKPDEQLDSEDVRNFHNNSQTIFLGTQQQISEEYLEYENDDVILYLTKDTKELNLKKSSDRIIP